MLADGGHHVTLVTPKHADVEVVSKIDRARRNALRSVLEAQRGTEAAVVRNGGAFIA